MQGLDGRFTQEAGCWNVGDVFVFFCCWNAKMMKRGLHGHWIQCENDSDTLRKKTGDITTSLQVRLSLPTYFEALSTFGHLGSQHTKTTSPKQVGSRTEWILRIPNVETLVHCWKKKTLDSTPNHVSKLHSTISCITFQAQDLEAPHAVVLLPAPLSPSYEISRCGGNTKGAHSFFFNLIWR